MDGKERRDLILHKLKTGGVPITGGTLAREFKVSRQIIVGDIAILRAAGHNVYATPQGYILPVEQTQTGTIRVKLACRHDLQKLEEELAIIIDNGGKVLDVLVEHAIYGEIKANLMLASRRDLAEFLTKLDNSQDEPLSLITGGVHLHTVEVPSQKVLTIIEQELKNRGILIH